MILVDFNQVMIATLMINLRNSPRIETDLVRHMVLNTLRSYRQRFGNKYGELVLCHDSRDPWRRDIFPYYKANRAKQKASTLKRVTGERDKIEGQILSDDSDGPSSSDPISATEAKIIEIQEQPDLTWIHIVNALNAIRAELKETFPYKNIVVNRAEADDIIAVLCKHVHEPIVIVSSDKDFQQLQKYPHVSQWSPSQKVLLKCKNPERFLKEHVFRGDTSDGVPNFLSPDDVLVTEGKRQKPISKKKLETWIDLDPEDFCTEVQLSYLDRNRQMVDFSFIPSEIEDAALEAFVRTPEGARSKIFPYFIKHKLTKLMSSIQEF